MSETKPTNRIESRHDGNQTIHLPMSLITLSVAVSISVAFLGGRTVSWSSHRFARESARLPIYTSRSVPVGTEGRNRSHHGFASTIRSRNPDGSSVIPNRISRSRCKGGDGRWRVVCEGSDPPTHGKREIRGSHRGKLSDSDPRDDGRPGRRREVASIQTAYHKIDIYDVNGMPGPSRRSSHRPDRLVYVDGDLRFSERGKTAYHEALVHPSMLCHFNPRSVAIIGDATGSTLREVLKHDTVEQVKLFVVDETMMLFYQKYMSSWGDCSDIPGSERWCFDDSRVEVLFEGALEWFTGEFDSDDDDHGPFDVIIMDVVDPRHNAEIADGMYREYQEEWIIEALYHGLSEDGVISWHLGPSPKSTDPAEIHSPDKNRISFITSDLDELNMGGIFIYQEARTGLSSPSSFLLSCKSKICKINWFANPAEIDVMILQRISPSHSGTSPLRHMDGPTFASYQKPHKVYENIYCRQNPTPPACQYIRGLPHIHKTPLTAYEVLRSSVGENSGRGIYAKTLIPGGSLLGYEYSSSTVHSSASNFALLSFMLEADYEGVREVIPVQSYLLGYGFEAEDMDKDNYSEYYVDSSINTFVNHGCNGTSNTGTFPTFSCQEHDDCDNYWDQLSSRYCPAQVRHRASMAGTTVFATQNIEPGEEILQDYSEMVAEKGMGYERDLENMCAGRVLGEVSAYETSTSR